jgi:hypothetical protein
VRFIYLRVSCVLEKVIQLLDRILFMQILFMCGFFTGTKNLGTFLARTGGGGGVSFLV